MGGVYTDLYGVRERIVVQGSNEDFPSEVTLVSVLGVIVTVD